MVRLNRTHYSLLKFYRQNFKFSKNCPIKSNSSELRKFRAVRPTQSANYAKFAHFVNISFLCFRHLPRQRTLQNSSELCKFRAIRLHSLRMTRNLHHHSHYTLRFRCPTSGRERHEILANQAKFARFAPIPRELREFRALHTKINTYVIDFQISDHRQRTQGKLERINKILLNSPTYYANYANSAHFAVN